MWLLKFKSEFKIILRFLTCPPRVTSAHLEAKNRSESQIRLQDSRWACLLYFFQKARDEQIFEREKDRWSLSNKHSIIIQIIEMPLLLLVKFRGPADTWFLVANTDNRKWKLCILICGPIHIFAMITECGYQTLVMEAGYFTVQQENFIYQNLTYFKHHFLPYNLYKVVSCQLNISINHVLCLLCVRVWRCVQSSTWICNLRGKAVRIVRVKQQQIVTSKPGRTVTGREQHHWSEL